MDECQEMVVSGVGRTRAMARLVQEVPDLIDLRPMVGWAEIDLDLERVGFPPGDPKYA